MNDLNSTDNSKRGNLGQFILGKTLGEGTFGKVKIATHITTGEKVAIKILEKIKILEESDKVRIDREIKILKSLMHKNIIQIYSVIENPTTIFLIMEYVNGGELFEYICLKQKLSELEACKFYQDIISGIEYLHKQGIVHRDLKPENLLLNTKKEIKIVDFGLSNIYKKGELLKTPCGSPCYAAPEMILGKQYNGLYVDIWSSGIILFAMIFGYLPFDDPNTDMLYRKITDGKFNIPSSASDRLKDFIRKILVTDPSKRIGLEGIKAHPWFNLITPKLFQGIFIKKYHIPVDETVIEEMALLNFNKDEVRELVMANRHNHITTTYYLILKKYIKMGRTSVADLSSDEYVRYINDPRSFKESIISRKSADKMKNSLEISKDTVIINTVETVRMTKIDNYTRTEETVVNNIISSTGTTASNNKLKTNSQSGKDPAGESNNPDFHNIYDETSNINITSESIAVPINYNNKDHNRNSQKENPRKNQNTVNDNNNNNFKVQENLNIENHNTNTYNNYCVTEANMNQTETNLQNNIFATEIEDLNSKENNNNNNERLVTYVETVLSHGNTTNSEMINTNNYNQIANQATDNKAKEQKESKINYNQPASSDVNNSAIPEYLRTEINNVATSSQFGNNTLLEESESNKNIKVLNKNKVVDKESVHYSNYVCATEMDGPLRTSVNKNEINYLITSHNAEDEHKNTSKNYKEINKNIQNIDIINKTKEAGNHRIDIDYSKSTTTAANVIKDSSAANRITNLKSRNINNNYNNTNENDINITSYKSKSPEIKKNVIFDKKNYMSKSKNNSNNPYKNNIMNTSYNENTLNTESSIKKETNRLNFGSNTVKNQYDQYLRSLIKTKAERFKKGFFNTSVSYEKSGDVRNRTADNKISEYPKSKSREKSPTVNMNSSIDTKKNNVFNKTIAFGKLTDVNNNKIETGRKLNSNKFQTNDPFSSKNSSKSRSKGKSNNVNMSRDVFDEKEELIRSDRFGKSGNASGNNYNTLLSKYKNAYTFLNQANTKRDKRVNISCPENSEYVKTEGTNKNIYIIKEDDEFKKNKGYMNKLKIPSNKVNKETTYENNQHSRNYTNQIPINSNRSTNNSVNKSRENSQYSAKVEVNSKYINNKLNKIKQINGNNNSNNNNNNNGKDITSRYMNYIPNHYVIYNPANNMNFNVNGNNTDDNKDNPFTPPKYSNYANFKMSTIKGNNYGSKLNSNNYSLNASVNENNNSNNYSITNSNSNNQSNTKNGTLTPNVIRKKMLNISEKMESGRSTKKTSEKKQALNNSKFKDISPPRIPIDKNSLNNNNKYKNININFYQNIIINNNNKKKNSSSNNNSVLNDDEKNSVSSNRQSPAFARDATGKAYYNQKNTQSGGSTKSENEKGNNMDLHSNHNALYSNNKISNFNEANANLKNYQMTKRSGSLSGSINSDVNTSKTTNTSNYTGDEELKLHIGPVDLVCVFNQRPQKLREEVLKALAFHKISIKPVLNFKYMLKCQKFKVKFDLEIMKFSDQENLLLIKFKKTEGTADEFKLITAKIIQTMKKI